MNELTEKAAWVMVPREPTEKMIAKGSWAQTGAGEVGSTGARNAYRAMLAAAPSPTVSGEVLEEARHRITPAEIYQLLMLHAVDDAIRKASFARLSRELSTLIGEKP